MRWMLAAAVACALCCSCDAEVGDPHPAAATSDAPDAGEDVEAAAIDDDTGSVDVAIGDVAPYRSPQEDYPKAGAPVEPVGCTGTLLGCEGAGSTFPLPATVGTLADTTDCRPIAIHAELRDGVPHTCIVRDKVECYGPFDWGVRYFFDLGYSTMTGSVSGSFSVRFDAGDAGAPTATFAGCYDTSSGTARCASPDTLIATPSGDRAIDSLAVGDLVYSTGESGFVVTRIARVVRVPAPSHHVRRIVLEGGGGFDMSAPHPLADGRTVGDLAPGDWVGGRRVRTVETVPLHFTHTVDILPDSSTGTYVAGGAIVGSTLSPR